MAVARNFRDKDRMKAALRAAGVPVARSRLIESEAELDRRIKELAERRGMPTEQLYASLEKAKRLRDVERSITEEKVFAFLVSQSTVEQT